VHELIELAKKGDSQGRLLGQHQLIMRDAPPPSILASADFCWQHGNRPHHIQGPDGATQPSPHGIRLRDQLRSGKGYFFF